MAREVETKSDVDHNNDSKDAITGLTHECGVFGALACGEWPSQVKYFRVFFFYPLKCDACECVQIGNCG